MMVKLINILGTYNIRVNVNLLFVHVFLNAQNANVVFILIIYNLSYYLVPIIFYIKVINSQLTQKYLIVFEGSYKQSDQEAELIV